MRSKIDENMVAIRDRCKKSDDLQYQKDISYLFMVIRQREYEIKILQNIKDMGKVEIKYEQQGKN